HVLEPRFCVRSVRFARSLPHRRESLRRANRRALGDASRGHRCDGSARRRARVGREWPARAQPAHHRQRQARRVPVGELLPLRPPSRPDRRQRRRLRVRQDAGGARGAGGGPCRRVPDGRGRARVSWAESGCTVSDFRHPRATRRVFLRGAAGAALALPFLESLMPRQAKGQAVTAPKRFIVLKSFSTQLVKEWYPAFTGNGYQLKDDKYSDSRGDGTTLLTQKLVSGANYTWAPLSDFKTDTGISGILGPKLNPFLDKLTLIRGLDFLPAVNHNYGGLLGNFSSCTAATPCDADSLKDVPTIDQVMAYSSKVYPSTPSLRYLHVSQGVTDSMSYSDLGMVGGAVQQLKARANPLDAFNDVFGTNPPTSTGGSTTDDRDKLL